MFNNLLVTQDNSTVILLWILAVEAIILIVILGYRNIIENNKNKIKNNKKEIEDLYLKIKEDIKYSVSPKFIDSSINTKDLIELAVEIWRIEKRIGDLLTNLSDSQKTGMESSIRKIRTYLTKNDIEIIDYTNQKYNEGLNLDVLSIEKKPRLVIPIIKETIEPTILCKGQVVKKAKVILQGK
jgi:hypothetical protein